MQKITPFLWFDTQAEEAATFYTEIFAKAPHNKNKAKNSKILSTSKYGEGAPMPAGTVMSVNFLLEGQEFGALNGGPQFKFTEAISFVIKCETQEEVDYFWDKLSAGGQEQQCGWVKDKFGVSWQIVPTILSELLGTGNQESVDKVMQAMLKMVKIDIAVLKEAAYN